MKTTYSLFLGIFLLIIMKTNAQIDNEMLELDINALMSVDVNKKSIPFNVDSQLLSTGTTINIGFLLPLSKYTDYATEMHRAAAMAIDEINSYASINEKKMYLIAADDAGDREVAYDKSNILIDKYKVAAIIGPTSSNRAYYVAKKVTVSKNIPLIAVDATADVISNLDDNNFVWRFSLRDGLFSSTIANHIVNQLNKKNVGVIYVNSQYGKGIYDEFSAMFKKLGGNITYATSFSELVDIQAFDMKKQLDSLFNSKPEVVFLITNAFEGAMITQKIKAGNYHINNKIIFVSSGANKGEDFLKMGASEIIENMIGIGSYTPQNDVFNKAYFKKYAVMPQYPEIMRAYDAVYLLAYSMLYSGSNNPLDFNKNIGIISGAGRKCNIADFKNLMNDFINKKTVELEGTSGNIKFNDKGDLITGKCEIWQVKNKQFVTLSIVDVK